MNQIRALGAPSIFQAGAAVVGLVIALYLAAIKLTGGLPACLPGGGCETVALSEYSSIFGVPVAFLGAAFSALLVVAIALWLSHRERSALYTAYALSLFGVVFVAYLTYLELFVVHAICQWCVAYAASVVITFVATAVETRRSSG